MEPSGAEAQAAARLGDQTAMIALRDRAELRSGQTVKFNIDRAKVHLFDDDGGRVAHWDFLSKARRRNRITRIEAPFAQGEMVASAATCPNESATIR
ncbi:ABC transporter [Rhizobium freirei PRF 81]|uniref:ABC transporter n=1 Tax=Rhizobium freirei PRF 81 TaxID=363754 RepID=N6VC83_9HYPH|nr:hypothetical protein [Rhizobium freirei]ENN88622.1 ABC transporter [Rhizobium freirei PRF 81]